jgi:serine/threonine-protein kinase
MHDARARIHELFDRALDLPPSEQAALLASLDPAIAAEVQTLLGLASEPDPHTRAWSMASDALWSELVTEVDMAASGRLGQWRLLGELGRGGMGTVHLAQRADGEFHQRAALKLLRPSIATDDALRRFELERQILAALTHPGIARLIDGGRTSDGHPYLVMELVEGAPIDRYCRERQLDVKARLALFLQVCRALDHAHRHMVVHGDVKPSNIIVGDTGEVKLLDFGIARLLPAEGGEPASTRTTPRAMTPEYASPEQLQGRAVTIGSDIYQLGVLLFELLTDTRAFDFGDATAADIERAVCHEPLRRPSGTVSLPAARRRALRGDLDSIVAMAVRKEPDRRYRTVERLADDVERYLARQPVAARGDTVGYRLNRFVGRHRVEVAAAALGAVLLVTWAATATVQARAIARERDRARSEAAKAEQVKDFVLRLFEKADPGEARGDTLTAQELLDRGWASSQAELAAQPDVLAEILDTVGQIYRELGSYDRAEPILARALDVSRGLGDGTHPVLATTLRSNARLRRERGDYAAAEELLREALDRQRAQFGDSHREVATTMTDLGLTLYARGDFDAATSLFRDALEMRRRLFGESHLDVADGLDKLGMALRNLGDYKAAEPLVRRSVELRRRLLPPDHPRLATNLSDLALVVQSLGDLDEAEALYRESLGVMIKVRGDSHPYVAVTMNNLARLLRTKNDLAGAEELLRRALEIRRNAFGDRHPQVAMNLSDLGRLVYDKGQLSEAEQLYREALERYPPGHPWRAATVFNLGRVFEDRRQYSEAERHYREALDRQREQYGPDHERVGVDLRQLGIVLHRQGHLEEAEASLRSALDIFRARLPEGHLRVAEALLPLGEVLVDRGRARAAEPLLREADQILRQNLPDEDPRRADAARALQRALATRSRH